MKLEGALEAGVLAAVLLVIGLLAAPRNRVVAGLVAVGAGLVTYIPWYAWASANGVKDRTADPVKSLDPGFLWRQRERLGPAADRLLHVLFLENRQWFLLVPLLLLLAAAAAKVRRRPIYLAPFAIVGATYAFWVWVFWADTDTLSTRLGAAGRLITPLMLLAAFGCAVLVQALGEIWPGSIRTILGIEPPSSRNPQP